MLLPPNLVGEQLRLERVRVNRAALRIAVRKQLVVAPEYEYGDRIMEWTPEVRQGNW